VTKIKVEEKLKERINNPTTTTANTNGDHKDKQQWGPQSINNGDHKVNQQWDHGGHKVNQQGGPQSQSTRGSTKSFTNGGHIDV